MRKTSKINRREFVKSAMAATLTIPPALMDKRPGFASPVTDQKGAINPMNIVSRHTALFTQPPQSTPTDFMSDGPLLGNGDVGVVLAGPPEEQIFYMGKNDFWKTVNPMVAPVGALRISTPELKGASYRQEQDIAHAEVRGSFSLTELTLNTRSWIASAENLIVIELSLQGARPVSVTLDHIIGELQAIRENNEHLNIGREQYGDGRWYFDGIIDDVRIYGRALSSGEVKEIFTDSPPAQGLALSWPENSPTDTRVTDGGPVQGKVGQTIRFDGKRTFVDLGSLSLGNAVTLSAWVNVAGYTPGSSANYIISKGEWNKAYSLGLSDGRIRMAIGDASAQTASAIDLNRWHLITGVYDGNRIAIYLDGIMNASTDNRVTDRGCDVNTATIAYSRRADSQPTMSGRSVTVATRLLGAIPRAKNGNELQFELHPGHPVRILTAVLSDLDYRNHRTAAKEFVENLTTKEISRHNVQNKRWWSEFWSKSFIEVPDKLIEQHWYGALYILASCSRAGKVAPGLWGNWITTDTPAWHGDFTLNYNFEAPYYIVYSSNHAEVAAPYYKAILDFLPKGREMARTHGWKGAHYPTHIGPWAIMTEGWQDWGQRSDAAYAALDFISHYEYTRDIRWLKTEGYPYLLEVTNFWEHYLKFENGRYVDYNDSIHEGSGPDVNGVLSLGLIHTLFKSMLKFSQDLNVDAERRAKWRHILSHLSSYPLQQRNGKTVFRYTEKGMTWNDGNDLGIQHIFPAGAIGLDSPKELLDISRSMVKEMARWVDGNAFSSFYTAAVRVGYDPGVILQRLRDQCESHAFPNLILFYGGGGIETCGGFLAVNEMLLQSYEGIVRLFPVWPKTLDARFGNLRASGAFLVSAELKGGVVINVQLLSEKGADCTVQNPWPGKSVALTRNGNKGETHNGERFTFKTHPGERIRLSAD